MARILNVWVEGSGGRRMMSIDSQDSMMSEPIRFVFANLRGSSRTRCNEVRH